jgi:hypothetical protein
MKEQKPSLHPDVVVEAVLQFKDRIIVEDNGEKSKLTAVSFICKMFMLPLAVQYNILLI